MQGPAPNSEPFDAIIIGAGQAAKPLALAFDQAGGRTAVIERKDVGGSCINFGCTPTKTLVAAARVADRVRHAGDYGLRSGALEVDMPRVRASKRDMVRRFRKGVREALESAAHVELIDGHARFSAPHEIEIALKDGGRRRLSAPRIFLNTGTRTARPPIAGLDSAPVLDPAAVMELDALPTHLVVIGGGYIGLEFAQMFRRFGSEVSIVQRGRHLLDREDADVAEVVRGILQEDGIRIYLDTSVQAVRSTGDGVELELASFGGPWPLRASHLLLAAGRAPNTHDLGLAAARIETDSAGYIRVNDRLETNVQGIYAMGDVKGGPAFTHISYDDYRVIRTNLLDGGSASIAGRNVPYTVFIDPQLGRVGMTEAEARQTGQPVRVAHLPMAQVARALESGETRGFMKAVVNAETGRILGCAILGKEGGELMAVAQVAMMGNVPYTDLRDAIFAHPTLAEAFNTLFADAHLA